MIYKKGGIKKGRKPATGNFNDLKNKNLGDLSYNDCMSLTLKNIRQTLAYQQLTPSANTNIRDEGKGVYRFGCKSTASKQRLCTFVSNPQIYYDVVESANNKRKPKERKLYNKRDRTGQRVGLCVPTKRQLSSNGLCDKNNEYTYKGLTTTGSDCCFKRKQSSKIKEQRRSNKNKTINKVPSNNDIKKEIKNIINNASSVSIIDNNIYKKLEQKFKVDISSKKKFIKRNIEQQIKDAKKE